MPERALRERLAAAARFVGLHAAPPQVHDLTERRDPGKLSEEALQQRGAAAPEASYEDHRLSV
ncbi:hypothetical protein Aph01nite_36840 [Acrocarpospora phusangensis]|uniref:Uncharacterized protein n=1 Tax=Acrocarpospora phusangensis TaxID=1070424 RepID=A0A919QCU5_9ACTN|nr:hypothetical protein Aph01nite_36840 [Acrocarpospora phusangensis]